MGQTFVAESTGIMTIFSKDNIVSGLQHNLPLILEENRKISTQLSADDLASLATLLQQANRIFVTGAGRSGLMLRAAAMRLMHLGLTVYVAGETTTPAIAAGDLLLAASGSGTTGAIVKAAEKAVAAGATVAALCAIRESPLAALAAEVVVIPAAQKQDFGGTLSQQYAGSLFEQSILLVTDALFQTLWQLKGTPAEELWKRHANLE